MADEEIIVYRRGEGGQLVPFSEGAVLPEMEDNVGALLQAIMLDDLRVEMHRLNEHFKKSEYQGSLEPLMLTVTDQLHWESFLRMWPFEPLIQVSIHNYGPNTAYIRVNDDEEVELRINDDFNPSYVGADRRIERLYYRCDTGETAQVQRIGKY